MKTPEPTKPTGNLEELFRHHLADAAVPPRPHVWEQVDNALLLAQNQTYRRRLQATRWVAAASLLLASLAGTGWWVQRGASPAITASQVTGLEPAAAPARQKPAFDGALSARLSRPGTVSAAASSAPVRASQTQPAVADFSKSARAASAAGRRVRPDREARLLAVNSRRSSRVKSGLVAWGKDVATASELNSDQIARYQSAQPGARQASHSAVGGIDQTNHSTINSASIAVTTAARPGTTASRETTNELSSLTSPSLTTAAVSAPTKTAPTLAVIEPETVETGIAAATAASLTDDQPQALPPLQAEIVNLALHAELPLPMALALQPEFITQVPATQARRWRLGLRYTAGAFRSNVNFSQTGADSPYPYNPVLGTNSPALTEAAAAEYLAQQRSGPSLRLQFQATHRLRGHWGLATGLEITQLKSQSATSYIFTGEQVYDYNQSLQGGPRRAASACYYTLGLPLELQYANPAKTGFSLYGRVGAVISALLSSRTDVEANSEATRTYNLFSVSTPYRRLLGTVRGAAGVQFRPAGHDYTISLGPVAEGGLWSLNAHPAQSFLKQYRPYSFGLEAGVEFGRGAKTSKAQ